MTDHHMFGAMRASQIGFRLGGHHADDMSADMARPLAQDETDTARSRMHHDVLPGLHSEGAAQQILRSEALQHHGRTGLKIDRIRQLHQPIGRDHALRGIGADRPAGIGHAVAHGEIVHTLSEGHDDAAALHTDRRWQRGLVEAGAKIHVDIVQADGLMAHQRLTAAGFRGGNVFPAHDLGAAIGVDADGFCHESSSRGWLRVERG